MFGRPHHVMLDTPDPAGLAAFSSARLALPVTFGAPDGVVVAADDQSSGWRPSSRQTAAVARSRVSPTDARRVIVEDPAQAGAAVLALGARLLDATRLVRRSGCSGTARV